MYEEFIGRKFSELTVLAYKGSRKTKWRTDQFFLCQCSCGKEKLVERKDLVSSHTKSCGCLRNRKFKDSKTWKGYEEISGRYWTQIKTHAKEKNRDFSITIQEAWNIFQLQNRLCALTGWRLVLNAKKGSTDKTASLDRIDSSKGYIAGNIQWVHKDINTLKSNFNESKLIELCCAVAHHKGANCANTKQDQRNAGRGQYR